MDSHAEKAPCPACGRQLVRWVHSYKLGRPDSPSYRMFDRWRHEDDQTLACEQPDG